MSHYNAYASFKTKKSIEKKELIKEKQNKQIILPTDFIIEKSYDGNSFVEIQKTKALNRLNNIYTVTDKKSLSGNVYYRLKQVDNNGDFTYSNIIVVRFDRVLAPFINTAIAKNILHLLYENKLHLSRYT